MTRRLLKTCALLGLAALLIPAILAEPGKGSGNRKFKTTIEAITASPYELASPISQQNHMDICVSGFKAGNWVTISVPLSGTPERHSVWTASQEIDSTGGFCTSAPPSYSDMYLTPGTYTIGVWWRQDRYSDQKKYGPSTTFTVTN